MVPDDELLTTEEVAAQIHTSLATLAEWRCKGGDASPPFIKLGRKILYPRSGLREFLSKRLHTSTAGYTHRDNGVAA